MGMEEAAEGSLLHPLLNRFSGNRKATLGHLITVHNETCGCQMASASQEATNRAWNQKKVFFMELQKQYGLDEFEDFLNRVLRLLLTHSLRDVHPLTEAEFWMTLRTSSYPLPSETEAKPMTMSCSVNSMEEDLADINNLIAKDIGGEPNQVFMNAEANPAGGGSSETSPPDPPPSSSEHFLGSSASADSTRMAASSSSVGLTPSPPETGASPSTSSFNPGDPPSPLLCSMDEMLRLKRKEKHMAPIDCSGLAASFNHTWKCKPCDRQHRSRDDCEFYRPYHQPSHVIYNFPERLMELPNELERRHDGVYVGKNDLKPYTRMGPLKGQVRFHLLQPFYSFFVSFSSRFFFTIGK